MWNVNIPFCHKPSRFIYPSDVTFFQNTLTCCEHFSALPVRDVLRPNPQCTSQTVVARTQKPTSVFTLAEELADAATNR